MDDAPQTSAEPRRFWNDSRLRRIAAALLVAFALSLGISYSHDAEEKSLLKRGDFPGFYAPAVIVARGRYGWLYDPALQRAVENEFWPSFEGEFYMSVYPPYV